MAKWGQCPVKPSLSFSTPQDQIRITNKRLLSNITNDYIQYAFKSPTWNCVRTRFNLFEELRAMSCRPFIFYPSIRGLCDEWQCMYNFNQHISSSHFICWFRNRLFILSFQINNNIIKILKGSQLGAFCP